MRGLRLAAALLLLAAGAARAEYRYDAEGKGRVFDRVWSLAERKYWDRGMAGLDWDDVQRRYRAQALAAGSERELYATINAMLDLLHDSHVYVVPPSDLRRPRPSADPPRPDAEPEYEWRASTPREGVLLLALDSFDIGADRWLIRQLHSEPRTVILDLRNNGGGASDVLGRIAGAFFTERRTILRLTGRAAEDERTRGAGPDAYRGRLIVLVGPKTASAAEALAALVQESGRGMVVGQRTAGRLTGAVHRRLPDGGELSLAEYDVRTSAGERIEGRGLAPHHEVPTAEALDRALELLR